MQLEANNIYIWTIELTLTSEQIEQQFALLDEEERLRANRYHSPIHRQRFIAAHAALRNLLGACLNLTPQSLVFAYSEHRKPYLPHHPSLQFNLSHSHDLALIGYTLDHKIGVDIEKIGHSFNSNVAKRFFSPPENAALDRLQGEDQIKEFYRLWSRKEALIKAVGTGIAALPLQSFSVAGFEESITLQEEIWSLMPLTINNDYQAAVASNQPIKNISYYQIINQTPT